MVGHVVEIIRSIPEVKATSRRTGLQLGLAAVTEANTGDISVNLSSHRSRDIYAIMDEVQAKVNQQEPALDIDLHQTLEDMIGDLTNAPQPVDIKLFSEDPDLLRHWAPIVADKISNVPGVVGVLNGIDDTISSPETIYHVQPSVTATSGFTPEEVATDAGALLQGQTAPTPLVVNNRPYNIRVRFPDQNRASPEAMNDTMLVSSAGTTATLGSLATVQNLPGQTEILRENLQRLVEVSARLEGTSLGQAIVGVKKAVAEANLPPQIRVEYGGTYATQQQSFRDLLLVLFAGFAVGFSGAVVRVQNIFRPCVDSGVGGPVYLWSFSRADDYGNRFQYFLLHGAHHGGGYCCEERHSAAGRRCEVPRARTFSARFHDSGGPQATASHRDDCSCRHGWDVPVGAGPGRRIADAAAAGDRSHRRHSHLDGAFAGDHSSRALFHDRKGLEKRLQATEKALQL